MNLTQTAVVAKQAIVVLIGLIFIYLVGYFTYPYAQSAYYALFPVKQKPLPVFGRLPPIKFSGIPQGSTPEYTLNTRDGRLPTDITPELVDVYQVIKPTVSFSAGQNAQRNASTLFFTTENLASSLSGNNFKWIDTKYGRELNINITVNTLNYTTNEVGVKDFLVITPELTYNSQDRKRTITGFLKRLGYFKDILYEAGTEKVTYGRIGTSQVEETITPAEYTLAKVDFFRSVEKTPILGPRIDNGLIQVVYAESKEEPLNYTRIKVNEWSINTTKPGKYPPVPIDVAWKAVTENRAAIARAKLRTDSAFENERPHDIARVAIETIYLAYYDSESYQQYMQPIYVFEGTFSTTDGQTGRIALYTPAIGGEYVASE